MLMLCPVESIWSRCFVLGFSHRQAAPRFFGLFLGRSFLQVSAGCLLLMAFAMAPSSASQSADKAQAFFDSTNLTLFQVELADAEIQELMQTPRSYVPGKVRVGERTWENVGIRLKGTGTFEPIYARPSLALKFNWKEDAQQFAGLNKLFLENSDQDASRLCKLVANGAFADAGVPAPRITQAQVELNGHKLGLYVVSEAINKGFLKHHFGTAEGNLYEAEFSDIDSHLKQDNGPPSDQSDLKELCAATRERDQSHRSQLLGLILDKEEFLNFLATEMIVANWDGYVFGPNNYRIYHNPTSGRLSFIPYDLDNTFAESDISLMPPRRSMLIAALLGTNEDRAAFRERVAKLVPKVLDPERIRARVQASAARLTQGADEDQAQVIQRQAVLFQQRIEERAKHLRDELAGTRPPTPVFDSRGVARLDGWMPKTDWNDASVEAVLDNGKPAFAIQATNGYCFGSWRLALWLPAGAYRIEGSAKTSGVAGLPSRTGSGAGVRVLGTRRGSGVLDSSGWAPVRQDFVVQEDCEWVELIAELRAFTGTAWFDPESLRLVRLTR
jgi:spore coat protein H